MKFYEKNDETVLFTLLDLRYSFGSFCGALFSCTTATCKLLYGNHWRVIFILYLLINFLRNGSIIANFDVSYWAIDSLQVVILQEQIASGKLGNLSAELLDISTNHGKKSG